MFVRTKILQLVSFFCAIQADFIKKRYKLKIDSVGKKNTKGKIKGKRQEG
jgi:hypothetical protein